MSGFPLADTEARFRVVARDEVALRPVVGAVCAQAGLSGAVQRFESGSLPVYAVGEDLVLKLYPPVFAGEAGVESRVLGAVAGRLPVPTPGVVAVGEVAGWAYVVMRRLRGVALSAVWSSLGVAERASVAAQVGESLAALHEVPVVDGLGPADWSGWLAEQRAGCVARQRALGADERLLSGVPAFLEQVVVPGGAPVLLHTEVMGDHLLVSPEDWRLSGLFDFEPAMGGGREYEFVAVGLFVTRGDAAALRCLLSAYGYSPGELGPELSRRLLAWTLVHRYCDLAWFLREVPVPAGAGLEQLAQCWFGV
ncbi:aminoglycoside 3'-phosphotransferase/choline kinase family protein [Kutzneria viridogrisea]|uniref:Aminoglycoside phosphotransferase domain-containing protein n=2 Tax=Kutzneria TaxID=43356 RepID=W5WHS9_9PSEU|nr:aminoglycoside 3'-phosphotransferase/choline kinase family protein [Kutzneria albida]AHH97714.1 hypothetical protein KALB_4352 [Kutzneria albida DSM 43870]MBA8924697.1 hygromycin-B 7''-O-kinase [Kutzneria viridogrisea]